MSDEFGKLIGDNSRDSDFEREETRGCQETGVARGGKQIRGGENGTLRRKGHSMLKGLRQKRRKRWRSKKTHYINMTFANKGGGRSDWWEENNYFGKWLAYLKIAGEESLEKFTKGRIDETTGEANNNQKSIPGVQNGTS